MSQNQKEYFLNSDLALIATLNHFGYSIEKIDKSNPSKVIFLIEKDGKLDDYVLAYWKQELAVEPMAFFNSIKSLKSRIYSD